MPLWGHFLLLFYETISRKFLRLDTMNSYRYDTNGICNIYTFFENLVYKDIPKCINIVINVLEIKLLLFVLIIFLLNWPSVLFLLIKPVGVLSSDFYFFSHLDNVFILHLKQLQYGLLLLCLLIVNISYELNIVMLLRDDNFNLIHCFRLYQVFIDKCNK